MIKRRKKIFLLISFLLILPLIVQGGLIDQLDKEIATKENRRMELERQAREYQAVVDKKQNEIKSLNNQIDIFNAQINKLQVEINISEDKIEQTQLEIQRLEYGIKGAAEDIAEQKEHIGGIIQSIAEYDQTSQMEIILSSDNFSDFFSQIAYLDNLQNAVQEKVEQLRKLKSLLEEDKESMEAKKERLNELKEELNKEKYSLAGQREKREGLLGYTKGQEEKYQSMLSNIEAQKRSLLGDINRLRQQKAAELSRLKMEQEKPPAEYWASTNWYYRQDDPRWAKANIGMSNSRMEDYGCAISSVAMVLTENGQAITPGQLAKQPIFYYDLLIWPEKRGNVRLVFNTYRTAADWFRIDREIGAGYPVIVRIHANGTSGGHYVVVHHKTSDGRYVVHDPLFGANIYLDSSRAFIASLYETTTSINQMLVYH